MARRTLLNLSIGSATLAIALAFTAIGATAQERSRAVVNPTRAVGEYAGVTPGANNTPPRTRALSRARTKNAHLITWPGFQPLRNGGSRFFLQVSASPQATASASEGRVEILLTNVRTHTRNTRRPLITEFFNTPVKSARLARRGRNDLAFILDMREMVTPNVTVQPEGEYFFVFIDFPAGEWGPRTEPTETPRSSITRAAPANPQPVPPQPTAGPVQLSNDEVRALDRERPPGM